jgi:GntR family transcriptional regulator
MTSCEPEIVLQGSQPIHAQIHEQIERLIYAGALAPGDELPTVRAIAVGLSINPGAVRKAYEALERAGLLMLDETSAPIVSAAWLNNPTADQAILQSLCRQFLDDAGQRGFSVSEVLSTLARMSQRGISS